MIHPLADFLSLFLKAPYIYLPIGLFFVGLGVEASFTGKARTRFGADIYRSKEPKQFWWLVAISYLAGFGFIGSLLYTVFCASS
jgi:hypothetical protein